MWSCKFAIELKYVRFNNKRNIELTDMVRYRLLLCTYTNTMGHGQVQMLQTEAPTSVWSFVLILFLMTCETISQWKWNCIFVYFHFISFMLNVDRSSALFISLIIMSFFLVCVSVKVNFTNCFTQFTSIQSLDV